METCAWAYTTSHVTPTRIKDRNLSMDPSRQRSRKAFPIPPGNAQETVDVDVRKMDFWGDADLRELFGPHVVVLWRLETGGLTLRMPKHVAKHWRDSLINEPKNYWKWQSKIDALFSEFVTWSTWSIKADRNHLSRYVIYVISTPSNTDSIIVLIVYCKSLTSKCATRYKVPLYLCN